MQQQGQNIDVEYNRQVKQAAEECQFAKKVSTSSGAAILINGVVLTVLADVNDGFWVDVLVHALRSARGQASIAVTGEHKSAG